MKILINDTKLQAFLIAENGEGETPPTLDLVRKTITEAGLSRAVPDEVLQPLMESGIGSSPVLIAEGRPPERGADGWVEHLFLQRTVTEEEAKDPHLCQLEIHSVRGGQRLSLLHPPTEGIPGETVFGITLPATPGKPVRLHGGKNVTLSADGVQLVATADGHAQQLPDGGVDVEPTYTIKGDVGPMTGNIDFVGSLIITGDVKSEFTVHAGNNVDVRGSVGDSEISADGDVRVAQGFVGTGKGKIVAGKTARVKHVHYQTVIGHTIVVEHECIGATLQAESKISSNRAVFIGGHLSAGDEVEVYDLGNGEETNVTVQVGARPRLLERLGEIERRAAQVEKQLTEVKAGMYKLVRIQLDAGTLTPEQEDLMNRLKKVQEDLPKELAAIAAEQVKLKGLMEQSMAGKIIARGTVAANAHLDINGVRKFVSSPMREVMFVEKSGRIEQLPA